MQSFVYQKIPNRLKDTIGLLKLKLSLVSVRYHQVCFNSHDQISHLGQVDEAESTVLAALKLDPGNNSMHI